MKPLSVRPILAALALLATAELAVAPAAARGAETLVIPHSRFLPFHGSDGWAFYETSFPSSGLGRYPAGGVGYASLFVSLDASILPAGARVQEICWYVVDDNATVDFDFGIYRVVYDGTASALSTVPIGGGTSGAPGQVKVCVPADLRMEYQGEDLDGDGVPGVVDYWLIAGFGVGATATDGSVQLRAAELRWVGPRR